MNAFALRALVAAREATIFSVASVAPFIGALLAPFVLPETFALNDLVAGLLMVV